jgi:CDP-diacylglycerol--serine O-phosphatidyltransferase
MEKDLRYFTLPNILTLFNLLAGSFAIFFAFEKSETLYLASYFILAALVFDFLDGFVARLLNAYSKIGAQLDSLADLVSFGIAPAVITYQMLLVALNVKSFSTDLPVADILILLSPVLLIVSAALRLAKFNVDERQKRDFFGLPTPASALFFISLPLLNEFNPDNLLILKVWLDVNLPFNFILAVIGLQVYIIPSFLLYVIAIIISAILQLLDVSMFSFKFDGLSFNKNKIRYIFAILSIVLFIFLQCFIVPFLVIFYVLFSIGDDISKLFIKK